MQEQEFRKLLDKYLDGTITEEEKEVLKRFEEDMMSVDGNLSFRNEFEKIKIKESLWTNIKAKSGFNKNSSAIWRQIAASAAIFIGLVALGALYVYNAKTTSSEIITEDAITLELEDGSLKIIEENGAAQVTDKTGTILGQQNGNQLVYSGNGTTEELVYNTLTVPFGRTFELMLSDGTKATLNAGSSLKYPVEFLPGQDRSVFISGEAYLEVAKDETHPFIVNAGDLNVRVLGTQFNVSAYPEDETTDVVLVEGSVSLSSDLKDGNDQNTVLLEPGFKGSFDKEEKAITKGEVITSLYTSWINGELIFRDMTFENIIKKLGRHYNVVIVNKNEALSHKRFNANFGNEPIQKVLEELKFNYGINYEFTDDSQIIIK